MRFMIVTFGFAMLASGCGDESTTSNQRTRAIPVQDDTANATKKAETATPPATASTASVAPTPAPTAPSLAPATPAPLPKFTGTVPASGYWLTRPSYGMSESVYDARLNQVCNPATIGSIGYSSVGARAPLVCTIPMNPLTATNKSQNLSDAVMEPMANWAPSSAAAPVKWAAYMMYVDPAIGRLKRVVVTFTVSATEMCAVTNTDTVGAPTICRPVASMPAVVEGIQTISPMGSLKLNFKADGPEITIVPATGKTIYVPVVSVSNI